MTGEEWPDKLILRSGWNPGDFFGLIELHPTSFPANRGGVMGLNRWGAPFTQIVTSKGASVENRLLIEDVNQQVKLIILTNYESMNSGDAVPCRISGPR